MASFPLPDQQSRWHVVEIFFSFFNFTFLSYLFISFTTECGQHSGVAASQFQGPGFDPELRLLHGFPLDSPPTVENHAGRELSYAQLSLGVIECVTVYVHGVL